MGRRIIDPRHRRLISKAFVMLRSISNPVTIRIIRIIEEHGEISVTDIENKTSAKYPISQPVISLKLSELRKYGIVKCKYHNRFKYYSMNHRMVQKVNRIARQLAEIPENKYV